MTDEDVDLFIKFRHGKTFYDIPGDIREPMLDAVLELVLKHREERDGLPDNS